MRIHRNVAFSPAAAAWSLVAGFMVAGSLRAQQPPAEVGAWIAAHAKRLQTLDLGHGFDDLRCFKAVIGDARIVALGEGTHLTHEFLTFRNRLFEYLVEECSFTAIATETHFLEALAIDAYVAGGAPTDADLGRAVVSWTDRIAEENRELVEWLRAHNANAKPERRVRFYGMDMTGARSGAAWARANPRRGMDAALEYIAGVERAAEQSVRSRIGALLGRFAGSNYDDGTLTASDQDAITAGFRDCLSWFDRRHVQWVAASSSVAYHRARQHVVNALWLDADFRAFGWGSQHKEKGDANGRDAALADNLLWALQREGPGGRILAFAHNGHVQHARSIREGALKNAFTSMGEHVHEVLGSQYVAIGTLENRGEIGWAGGEGLRRVGPADPASANGTLASAGLPLFAVDLHELPPTGPVAGWWDRPQRIQNGATNYSQLRVAAAFDGLVFVDVLSPMRPAIARSAGK